MKTTRLTRFCCGVCIAAGIASAASGCGEKGSSAAQQAELKQGFDNRTSDMSKLPPDVKARMQGYAGGSAPNSNPTAPKPAPAAPPK